MLEAYNNQCAITYLPIPALLEAAYITPDCEKTGYASINNGIALSRIHHKAYDCNLLGIDPDYKIHISDHLLNLSDGPLLDYGLKEFHKKILKLPENSRHFPDKGRLEDRFSALVKHVDTTTSTMQQIIDDGVFDLYQAEQHASRKVFHNCTCIASFLAIENNLAELIGVYSVDGFRKYTTKDKKMLPAYLQTTHLSGDKRIFYQLTEKGGNSHFFLL